MSSQLFTPVVGENVNRTGDTGGWENGRWRPGSRPRSTLHDVRMTRTEQTPEEAPQPVEVPQQPYYYDVPQQAATNFTQGDTMAVNHTLDDLEDFDPYDREQMNALIERRVQAALAPSRHAQHDAELVAQYNRVVGQYGSDANFKSSMDTALQLCLADDKAGRPIDIAARYEEVSDSTSRRPGQRSAHIPEKARTIKDLGKLIDFNHQSGRARPYRPR